MTSYRSQDFTSPRELDELVTETIARTEKLGPEGVEVAASVGDGLSITVRAGKRERIEHQQGKSLAITVFQQGRKGTATTSDFSRAALDETIAAAKRISDYAEPDQYAGLAEVEFLASDIEDLGLDCPWEIDAESAIKLALECEAAALGAVTGIKQSDGCDVSRHRGTRAYGNSNGFHAAYRGTRHGISAAMIAENAMGMQSGYWFTAARDPRQLQSPESVGEKAARRTVAKLGARQIETAELPVLFEAPVASSLIRHLVDAISGSAQYRRASFLLDKLAERVAASTLTIREEPHLFGAIGSAPFDDDGVATSPKTIVDSGTLETYLLGAYSARRLKLEPTGNAGGVHNLIVGHQDRALDELIANLDKALLVTELMGFGVNTVTGDYSRGASGFFISEGKIDHPVEEITIAGNLKTMLLGIQTIANDVDRRGNIHTGSILIDKMAIAGA